MDEYISFYELHLVAPLVTIKEREKEQDVLRMR